MAFTLDQIVPWGRSYEEYVSMFSLSMSILNLSILGCADGPSSFNAGFTRRGGEIISADPLYRYGSARIAQRIKDTQNMVLDQTRQNEHDFVWSTIHSVQELGRIRMSAMHEFLVYCPINNLYNYGILWNLTLKEIPSDQRTSEEG